MMYLIIPEIIKNVNTKIIQKDDSTILSYKCIFLEYSHKLIEVSFYTAIIDNYNHMYYSVPNTLVFPMYIWRGFIEMHRYRYYCELLIGTIIITTFALFYPFIKRFYNKFDLIISNITSIPVLTYRNLFNAISEGQSLHIEIENIEIISIPPKIKVNMTEEELENAPADNPKSKAFENDNRLIKSLLLSSLVHGVEVLKDMNCIKLAALNHGTVKSRIPNREVSTVADKLRALDVATGTGRIAKDVLS